MCFARPPAPGDTASLSCTIIVSSFISHVLYLLWAASFFTDDLFGYRPRLVHSGKTTPRKYVRIMMNTKHNLTLIYLASGNTK